jgi:pimeloyl-ACP methyl ester carboxylesterase/DNA-binding CsgD family transcriptional regulator
MNRHSQQIRFCTSQDGTRIAFEICGNGPPLVMAGQSFSHLEGEWDCLVRAPLLEFLSQNHTLVRYDMRGTGLSDRDCAEFSFARYVEDLGAVIRASGFDSYAMLGLTGGGALAVTHAVAHPKEVTQLVMAGSYLRGRSVRSTTPSAHEETELILKLVELGWGQDSPTFRQLFTYQFLPDGTPEQLQSFDELMRKSVSAKNAALQLRAWFSADLRDVAPRLKTPTLVLHSRGDLRIPFDEGRLLAASIPAARFVTLDSRNHFILTQEAAWQHLTHELTAFLAPQAGKNLSPIESLTAREQAVLEVLSQGLETADMAERLCMSEKTVRNHLSSIYSKLEVSNRLQAVLWMEDNQKALAALGDSLKADNKAGKNWVAPWARAK